MCKRLLPGGKNLLNGKLHSSSTKVPEVTPYADLLALMPLEIAHQKKQETPLPCSVPQHFLATNLKLRRRNVYSI